EPLLAPARPDGPNRDYLGRVIAPPYPLTREAVAELAADYDLRGATIESFHVERAGGSLRAALTVALPRTYADGSASLHVWL
ncbi:hypothetical protein G3I76_54895, partial [Streptomyces sp. SID11233]|nr:hypothetical protein [Streptomyces sp. SID11233]